MNEGEAGSEAKETERMQKIFQGEERGTVEVKGLVVVFREIFQVLWTTSPFPAVLICFVQ